MIDVRSLYPQFTFVPGPAFRWSPRDKVIQFINKEMKYLDGQLSLLHEVAHGLLEHTYFVLDVELIQFEVAAWRETRKMAEEHGIKINNEMIERCLDTYRDWLFARSRCPNCAQTGAQTTDRQYRCFICNERWRVPEQQTCMVKRFRLEAGSK